MLSTLPKLADRTFVLGFFLPTLLFAIAGLLLFSHVGDTGKWLDVITAKEIGRGAYLLLAIWVGALVLLILNRWWYQLLEGYKLPNPLRSWLRAENRSACAAFWPRCSNCTNVIAWSRHSFRPISCSAT